MGIRYKQNPRQLLQPFLDQDKTRTGVVNMKKFSDILQQLDPNLNDNEIREIFMRNCGSGGSQVQYKEWLDNVADIYAQDVHP
jgi:Ca2+-binding EF-hand superfamily protein